MWDVMLDVDVDVDVDAGRRRETRQDKDTWGQLLIQVLQHEYTSQSACVLTARSPILGVFLSINGRNDARNADARTAWGKGRNAPDPLPFIPHRAVPPTTHGKGREDASACGEKEAVQC